MWSILKALLIPRGYEMITMFIYFVLNYFPNLAPFVIVDQLAQIGVSRSLGACSDYVMQETRMLLLTLIYDDIVPWIPSLISCFSAMISDTIFFTTCRQLLQMLFATIFFHCSEYILAISIHGKNNVTLKSLLISKNYILAMIISLIEYLVEICFFPGLKEHWLLSNIGLAMVVFGEIIRKLAIITAGRSFTHLIKIHHEEHHVLVTHGVYRYIRHPSYCGFLIWSVGTQIMVCNPLSTVAFAFVVWRFFQQRIPYEEFFLRQFFGLQYEEYTDLTFSGIPFIK